MSIFKKLLALTVALAMILSVSAFAGYSKDTYKDAASIDADCEEAVELMYALEIMKGDDKGNFNPEATITRAEVIKMIYVILNYGEDDMAVNFKGGKFFSDVVPGSWYEGYVNYAATTKLVQGRGNGTFGPNDPVTCAEAAKMLLTAIGYSAEARQYTGANWAQNVLSDASIIGLLDGYDYNTNTYAPRQWVAVMFENALLKAYTFGTMKPTFSGLLTSGSEYDASEKMGEKYYDLKEFEAVAYATNNASIDEYDVDGTANDKEFAATDYVLFSNGKEIKGTGLGAMDLGQTYRVIYDSSNNKAYSVRSLYETAEARVLDIEVDVVYGTSSNKAQNKYEFTVDGVTAKFADSTINVLKTGTDKYDDVANSQTDAETIGVTAFYNLVKSEEKTNDLYKVVLNDDGEIAYIIVTEYAYAEVEKDASHNRYGDYIKVDGLTFNGGANLYLDDCIITDDEIVEDDIVKYTWDLDEGMFVMEVLPTVEDVVYEARDNDEKIYTLGGEDYYVNKYALTEVQAWLNDKDNMDEAICLVVDGDMIVYHWFSDSDFSDMADINAQLVLVTDAESEYSNNTIREQNAIEYMTIDGEKHIAVYQNKTSDDDVEVKGEGHWEMGMFGPYWVEGTTYTDYYYVQFDELLGLGMDEYDGEADLEGRLFILHEGTQGRVYLEELDNATINDQLDASTSLLNKYEEKTAVLDATGTAIKYDSNTMAADNLFFFAYDDDGDAVFGVTTPAELGDGKDETVYGQTLSYVKSPSMRQTVLGGYIVVELDSDETNDYLYITEIGRETASGVELTVQKLGAEETEVIYYEGDEALYVDMLYAYNYKTMDDEYSLNLLWEEVDDSVDYYDEEYYELRLDPTTGDDYLVDVSDDDEVDYIVIVTVDHVRSETQDDNADADWLPVDFMDYDRTLEVVAYEDLTAAAIESDSDDSYVQISYAYYNAADEVLYFIVDCQMIIAQ